MSSLANINREKAWDLVIRHLPNENARKHLIATEAIMRKLAKKFGEDEEFWGLAGLLHDLDLETTRDNIKLHGLKTAEILKGEGVSDSLIALIQSHNAENLPVEPRKSRSEILLAAAEQITGLIVACALVLPSKKIADIKETSIKKRMKEKSFARNVSREIVQDCERAGIPLDEFIGIALGAMREIAPQLGL